MNSRVESGLGTSSSSSSNTETATSCKYFKNGNCKYGNDCRFLHESQNELLPSITSIPSEDWVNAPEFIPSATKLKTNFKSYAQVVKPDGSGSSNEEIRPATSTSTNIMFDDVLPSTSKLCPYAEANGECRYPRNECSYLHGDICELCGVAALHPHDQNQRKRHQRECVSQHEKNMELSFAVARSREKSCGVCFEVILEKSSGEQRFGILPNCNHCFCLGCIRKWRQAKQFDSKIIRACPECRVTSDFVCPSMYWVDTKDEKDKLITDYKGALRIKDCKYFKLGRGKCPFGNKCFYLHALPDGTKVDVGPPVRHRRQPHDTELDMLHHFILWDFLDERANHRWIYSLDDLEDFVAFFSDSEDSDWSEYDFGPFE